MLIKERKKQFIRFVFIYVTQISIFTTKFYITWEVTWIFLLGNFHNSGRDYCRSVKSCAYDCIWLRMKKFHLRNKNKLGGPGILQIAVIPINIMKKYGISFFGLMQFKKFWPKLCNFYNFGPLYDGQIWHILNKNT